MFIRMASCCVFFLACSCMAEIVENRIFFDNFESVPSVTWPDSTKDADPIAQTGQWLILEQSLTGDNPAGIQVCKNLMPGPAAGSNYLALNRIGAAVLRGNLASPGLNLRTTVEFDMWVNSAISDKYNNGVNFWVRNSTSSSGFDYDMFYDYFRANGVVYHGTAVLGNYPTDTWIHIVYEFVPSQQTYNLTIGSQRYSSLSFSLAQPQFQQIVYYAMAPQSTFYIDNVTVKNARVHNRFQN